MRNEQTEKRHGHVLLFGTDQPGINDYLIYDLRGPYTEKSPAFAGFFKLILVDFVSQEIRFIPAMLIQDRDALIDILRNICELLQDSQESDWRPLSPEEVEKNILGSLNKLENGKKLCPSDKLELSVEFEVTSTLQEIAMANDWHDEYLKLATDFDRLIKRV